MDDGLKNSRKFTLKARHLLLAAGLLAAGAVGLHFMIHRHDADRRLEVLRAAGYPTGIAELAEYTRLPEGVENAAEVYARAFAAFVPPADEANVPLLGKAKLPDRGVPVPEPMIQAIADCLAANRECLALLHEAGRIEYCRYDWDYADELSPLKAPPHWGALRRCGWLVSLNVVLQSLNGDTEAVVACVEDWLPLIESLRREPGVIGHLVRIASRAALLNRLEWVLNATSFTERRLQDLDRMLSASSATLDLREAMITQQCIELENYRNVEYTNRPAFLRAVRHGDIIRPFPGMRARGFADLVDYWQACVEAAALPVPQRLPRFREIDEGVAGLSFLHAMIKIYGPGKVARTVEVDLQARAHLDLAKAALAVERYRLATGNVPEQLGELVPRHLERVPIDPFDGRPIRYRRTEPGYVLYSILTDGQDNGGRERNEVQSGQPYDECFVVTR